MTGGDDTGIDPHRDLVRPFTLTGGRTEPDGPSVGVETIVCRGRRQPTGGPIETEIWHLAAEQISAAEISHRLRLPFGVVRVLVSDLTAAGHLRLGQTAAVGDVTLIKRLIDGIRAL